MILELRVIVFSDTFAAVAGVGTVAKVRGTNRPDIVGQFRSLRKYRQQLWRTRLASRREILWAALRNCVNTRHSITKGISDHQSAEGLAVGAQRAREQPRA